METLTITRLDVPVCKLGEGPVWDIEDQALYYVDAAGGKLNRYDPGTGELQSWEFDGRIACLGLRERGGAIVALWNGIHLFDFVTGELTLLGDPDAAVARTSLNDGKVDPRGRYVCGSVDLEMAEPLGKLYGISTNGSITTLDDGITISNGPCWSPDGKTFYHADSVPKTIYAYDYDLDTGLASNKRVFATTDMLGGIPDGATVDAEGYLWTAVCEAGLVARFAPDGSLDRTVELPTPMVSSLMFGGPDLDRLFVTSIDPRTFGKKEEEGGGGLYVIDGLGIRGLPEPRYAG